VAEDPAFEELCVRLGLVFIGPPASAMRQLCDRIQARLLAERTGVPVAPWSGGPVSSSAEAARHGDMIGYPLLIKAASGRGGRGIRVVLSADELKVAYERACSEAEDAFGDPVVFTDGVVGRVSEVRAYTSVVEMISSPSVRLAAVIEGDTRPVAYQGGDNPTFGPAKGSIEFVPLDVFAQADSPRRLETSGLGGEFPRG